MPYRSFSQLDVFASGPLSGNPLGCVTDAEGLSTDQMQRFAKWTNLSECSFLLEPTKSEADYRVRIFTPGQELPFAGHPTIGSCQAWLNSGGQPKTPGRIVQECGIGLVELNQAGDRISFAAPPLIRGGAVDELFVIEMAGAIGIDRNDVIDARWGDNGAGWVVLLLGSAAEVLALERPSDRLPNLDLGVIGLYAKDQQECALEVRAFFAHEDGVVREDPVTGSLNAAAAQWLLSTSRLRAPYVVSQGTALGRRGRIYVDQDDDGTIWVGGISSAIVVGQVSI